MSTRGFAGTLSIGQAALELLLVELVRSATGTFGRVLLLNGHGGNVAPLGRAVALLRAESRDVRTFSPRWPGDRARRADRDLGAARAGAGAGPARGTPPPGPPHRSPSCCRRCAGTASAPSARTGCSATPPARTPVRASRLLDAAAAELAALLDGWAG